MSTPCVFFDRDGIVNRRPTRDRYVRRWDEFELIPEFADALKVVLEHGYEAVIVTNQKGISTGRMTQADVDHIHHSLRAVLRARGLHLCDIMVCAAPDDHHTHRKPNPGMLIEAARKHGLDLARSWMIGDQEKDVEAGRRAGCRTVLVGEPETATAADYRVPDMAALVLFLRKHLPAAPPV
jgi:D-glycero-D-manno-heptose 1,7-bisphosphate phosphatase